MERARRGTPARERAREEGQRVITSIDRNAEGAWRISAFVGEGAGEYLLTRTYYFYTKAQAIAQFKQDIKREGAI
jgi:hypothetical protein